MSQRRTVRLGALALALQVPGWALAQSAVPPAQPTPAPSPTEAAPPPAASTAPAAVPAAEPPSTPAPAAVSVAPAATPSPPPQAKPAEASDDDLSFAVVHIASNYGGTWLELRDFVESGDWFRACQAPCDLKLRVEGSEARVSAEGMSTSNVFRIEPGRGRALIKVDGGSSSTQRWGITGLIVGIPLALLGGGLLGYGIVQEEDALKIGGGVTLGIGATMVLGSLPLLVIGGTDVHDGKGKQIAGAPAPASGF